MKLKSIQTWVVVAALSFLSSVYSAVVLQGEAQYLQEETLDVRNAIIGSMLAGAVIEAIGDPVENIKDKETLQELFGDQGIVNPLKQFKEKAGEAKSFEVPRAGTPGSYSYFPFKHDGTLRYTDDTAMSMDVTIALLRYYKENMRSRTFEMLDNSDSEKAMGYVAEQFYKDSLAKNPNGWQKPERFPGSSTGDALLRLSSKIREGKTEPRWWMQGFAGNAANGSVMRAAPFGMFFKNDPEKAARWAAMHSLITHGHPEALKACAALAAGIAHALQGKAPTQIADEMIGMSERAQQWIVSNEFPKPLENQKPSALKGSLPDTTEMLRKAKKLAEEQGELKFSEENFSIDETMFSEEYKPFTAPATIAAALYCFLRSPRDICGACALAVNSGGDSDTIGKVVGDLWGAHNGHSTIPQEWTNVLENKDEIMTLAGQIADVMLEGKAPDVLLENFPPLAAKANVEGSDASKKQSWFSRLCAWATCRKAKVFIGASALGATGLTALLMYKKSDVIMDWFRNRSAGFAK